VESDHRPLIALPAPPGTIPTGKGPHQVTEIGVIASKGGTDWTAGEVAVLLGSYFLMLADELAGRDYRSDGYARCGLTDAIWGTAADGGLGLRSISLSATAIKT